MYHPKSKVKLLLKVSSHSFSLSFMGEETKSFNMPMLHTAEGEEPKKVAIATAVEEESNKAVATLKEKIEEDCDRGGREIGE